MRNKLALEILFIINYTIQYGFAILNKKRMKGGHNMPTQIAPTPVIKGKIAKQVLKEVQKRPTEKTRKGFENIQKMFEGKIIK